MSDRSTSYGQDPQARIQQFYFTLFPNVLQPAVEEKEIQTFRVEVWLVLSGSRKPEEL